MKIGGNNLHFEIHELLTIWRKRAARKFKDAETEKNIMGKKLIEHGAMCYFNCSQELEKIAASLPALATQTKSKPSKKLRA